MENTPPYKHWHVVCAACSKVTGARPSRVPGPIEPMEHNPVITCSKCGDTRQYLTNECFLAPMAVEAYNQPPDRAAGATAVVAGLIAAVKLARVDSREIQSKSPRVRSVIADSVTIAKMVIDAVRSK